MPRETKQKQKKQWRIFLLSRILNNNNDNNNDDDDNGKKRNNEWEEFTENFYLKMYTYMREFFFEYKKRNILNAQNLSFFFVVVVPILLFHYDDDV